MYVHLDSLLECTQSTMDRRPRELFFATILVASVLPLRYLVTPLKAGAQVMSYEPKIADIIKLAMDCLAFWKHTTIIFISDTELPLDIMDNKIKFQQVESIQEFVEQGLPEMDSILALSMSPITDNDATLLWGGLLQKITLFIPQIADTTFLEKLKLRLDSGLFLYERKINASVVLHEAYAIKGGPPRSQVIGSWSIQDGLMVTQGNMFERRKNLSGVTVINTVLPWVPISVIEEDGSGFRQSGLCGEQFEVLKQMLGFTAKFVQPEDGAWGTDQGNLTWNGMVGMLQRGEADVSSTGLSPNLARAQSVDFTRILLHYEVGVTLPRTDTVFINYLVYVDVFFANLWFTIAGMAITLSTCFFIIALQRGNRITEDPERFGILNSFALVFLIFLQRDYPINKSGISTRILYFTTCASAFLIFATYESVLTSWMTAKEPPAKIRSFEDIRDQELTLYFWKGGILESFLRDNFGPDTAAHELYMAGRGLSSTKEAFDAVRGDKDAAVFDTFVTFWGQDHYTKTAKMDEISSVLGAWGLQKDSEFRDMFNHHLAKMHETGVLSLVDTKWMSPDRPQTPVDPSQVFTSLGGDMLFFPFSFLLIGIVGSVTFAAIEKVLISCQRRGNRHGVPEARTGWNP